MPERANTCAVVVTYHPDDALSERVNALAAQVARVYIVDNGSGPATSALLDRLEHEAAVETVRNPENLGIAAALNQGLDLAVSHAYPWAITMDQDSTVMPDFAQILFRTCRDHPARARIGVVGSSYSDPGVDLARFQRVRQPSVKSLDVRAIITSGCLTSLDAWAATGPFREELFIDCVDEEFCLRLRRRGYLVVKALEVGLIHRLGDLREYRLLGRVFLATNHSSLRRYYMTRNAFTLMAAHVFTEPLWVARKLQRQLTEWLGILVAEQSGGRKARAILLGLWHALRGRSGRLAPRLAAWLAEP